MELYGHPISQARKTTLTEQVCDILLTEIQRGRWRIGERLPSIAELAEQGGLTRAPVAGAFEMLRQAGYIEQKSRRGSFLIATSPLGQKPSWTVGVVAHLHMPATGEMEPISQNHIYLMHLIVQEAARRNSFVETHYLVNEAACEKLDGKDGPFGGRVQGVISLHPFPRPPLHDVRPGCVPLVFLGTERNRSVPSVAGNSWYGGYRLTMSAVELGHRQVILCSNPAPISYGQSQFIEGHREAMTEKGLEVNELAIRDSQTTAWGDLTGLRDYLVRYKDATCILAGSHELASDLLQVAKLAGIDIPGHVSLACIGAAVRLGGRRVSGITFRSEEAVKRAFDMLEELIRTGEVHCHRQMLNPLFRPGETLAPPRDAQDRKEILVEGKQTG